MRVWGSVCGFVHMSAVPFETRAKVQAAVRVLETEPARAASTLHHRTVPLATYYPDFRVSGDLTSTPSVFWK